MNVNISIFRKTKLIFILICIILSITWLTVMFLNTLDIPIYDDYSAILGSTIWLVNSHNWQDAYQALVHQHDVHRPVLVRAFAFLMYKVFDEIYFNYFALFGNILLVLIPVVLIKAANSKVNYLAYLPVFILICSLQNYRFATFAMASVQNHGFLLFSILSIVIVTNKGIKNVIISVVFLVIALLLQGGALPVICVILLILFLQKRHYENFLFMLIILCFCIWYFWDFRPTVPISVLDILSNSYQYIVHFLNFLGSAFREGSPFITPLTMGLAIVILFGYITWKRKYYEKNIILFSLYLYFILLAIINSLFRSQFGTEYPMIREAYALYSLLTISVVYMVIIEVTTYKYIKVVKYITVVLIAIYLFSATTLFYYKIEEKREFVDRIFVEWIFGQKRLPINPGKNNYKKSKIVLIKAENLGIYEYRRKYKNLVAMGELRKRNKTKTKSGPDKLPNNEWNIYVTFPFRSTFDLDSQQEYINIKLGYYEDLINNKQIMEENKRKNIKGVINFEILGKLQNNNIKLFGKTVNLLNISQNAYKWEEKIYIPKGTKKIMVIMKCNKEEYKGIYLWFNIKLEA